MPINYMKLTGSRKILAILAAIVLLDAATIVSVRYRNRKLAETAQAVRIADDLRARMLHLSMQIDELINARQIDDALLCRETQQDLRYNSDQINRGLEQLAANVENLDIPSSRDYLPEFRNRWSRAGDAVTACLESRSVMRNRDFLHGELIELAHRIDEIGRDYEKVHSDALESSTAFGRLLTGISLLLTLWAGWMLVKELLGPLSVTIDQLKLMSSGKLSLATQIPRDKAGDLRELAHYFNVFVERLRSADQTKDRFLAAMSHEIRTPMNGVIGFLGNLRETELKEQQRQYLTIIESSARSLLHVINEILDFSKLKSGRVDLEIVAFDLVEFLKERIAVAEQLARSKELKLELEMPESDDLVVRGDPTRLRQVLDNLLSNAVKFSEGGKVVLKVEHAPVQDNRIKLSFSVCDTGPGIPPDEMEHVFEAFAQAEASTTRRFGGTGLGLPIASDLVSLMGGKLEVESRPGEGARFYFEIETDVAPREEQIQFSSHHEIQVPEKLLKRYWALLVDDTPTNLFLMETICQGIGLPYMTAVNGQEAVDKVKQFKFDLIFMDIQMPVMDGYTAIREIRKLENADATQIIALTASAFQEDVNRALGAGSTGFLAKPFERNQLLLCIAEHLGIPVERKLREIREYEPSEEEMVVRRMYDYMQEQYRISLGEIKRILAQTMATWRPQLDDVMVFSGKGNWEPIRTIMHRFKGQLSSIGLGEFAATAASVNERIKDGDVEGLPEELSEFVARLSAVFRAAERNITLDRQDRADASIS